MKRIIIFLFSMLVLNTLSHAQFSLDSINNTPKAEHQYYCIKALLNNTSPYVSGPNVIWDMSAIQMLSDTVMTFYTKDTNYNAFPSQHVNPFPCLSNICNLKSFEKLYKITNSNYVLAYELVPVEAHPPAPCPVYKKILQFPFTFNDSIEHFWSCGRINLAYRKIVADAYGKLILPNITYNNVLRVHTYERQEFDISNSPHTTRDTIYYNIYEWYSENMHIPVFSIHYKRHKQTQYGLTTNYNYRSVYVYNKQVNLTIADKLLTAKKDLLIYPNPSNGEITIRYIAKTTGQYNVIIIDKIGCIVYKLSNYNFYLGSNKQTVNLKQLSKGVFTVLIEFNNIIQASDKLIIL